MNERIDIITLNRNAWNRVAERYDKSNYGKLNDLIVKFCDILPKNGSVLDLGSGTGLPFAKFFIERGFRVLGIDFAREMIRIAKRNVPQAKFEEMSMTKLEFDNMFDGIFSSYSMLLLNPPLFNDVARRISRALKNSGLFYLALNEPKELGVDPENDSITKIMNETMYSRAYTEQEICEIFNPLQMELLEIYRVNTHTEEFGEEHTICFLFKKNAIM